MTALQFFVFTTLPITGMCYAVLGALKLPLADRLQMDEAKVGGLVSSFGIMVGPIILAAGFLSDSIGRQGVWIGGAVMVTAALIVLSRVKSYPFAVISVLLLSGGWAAMINVANPVMFSAFENPLTATNTGDFFFGLGAFLTPAGLAILLRKLGYSPAVGLLAALAGYAAVLGFVIDIEPAAAEAPTGESPTIGFGHLISDPVMWLCALTMLLWAPLESATAAWTTTFVSTTAPAHSAAPEDPAHRTRIAEWTLSGFWMCFMGSRLLMAIYHQFYESANPILEARITHIVIAALAIVAMVGLVRSKSRCFTIGIILFSGLLMGPFFPNLMAILLDHVPVEVGGRAVGIVFAGASVGWTVIPLVIGNIAARTGSLRRGFIVAIVNAVLLLGVVIGHLIYARANL